MYSTSVEPAKIKGKAKYECAKPPVPKLNSYIQDMWHVKERTSKTVRLKLTHVSPEAFFPQTPEAHF